MLSLSEEIQIYLAPAPVDMRQAIDGLSMKVVEVLEMNPQNGHVFIFYNKSRNKVKLLTWDKNGFLLLYKRLEKHRFKIPRSISAEELIINRDQVNWLLAGLDFMTMKQFPELNFNHYF